MPGKLPSLLQVQVEYSRRRMGSWQLWENFLGKARDAPVKVGCPAWLIANLKSNSAVFRVLLCRAPKLAKGSWARYKFSRLGERRSRLVSERRRLFVNRRILAALETDLGFRFLGGVATDKTISLSLFKQSATFCP